MYTEMDEKSGQRVDICRPLTFVRWGDGITEAAAKKLMPKIVEG